MEVDPWDLVVRHGLWYLLCWSHAADARRVLRVDRMVDVRERTEIFVPPAGLDPVRALEEQLSQGWTHEIEVLVDAPADQVAGWMPRTTARVEAAGPGRTRLRASTDELEWYAAVLAGLRAPFHVVTPAELRDAVAALGRRLVEAGTDVRSGL